MSAQRYESMARTHWIEWLPNKAAELKEKGEWEISLQIAGKQAFEMVLVLMQQGLQQHEAEDVALKEFVLLSPEPRDPDRPANVDFDEETYAKAKPLFISAVTNIRAASKDLRDAMKAVVSMVVERFGAETAKNMKPYVVRFVQDVRDGKVQLEQEAPTMLGLQYTGLALRHWAEWLPKMTAELRAEGMLDRAAQRASKEAARQVADLMMAGMQKHEAEEMVLPDLILLKPEPPDEDDWEARELAELEAEYQQMMREPQDPDRPINLE